MAKRTDETSGGTLGPLLDKAVTIPSKDIHRRVDKLRKKHPRDTPAQLVDRLDSAGHVTRRRSEVDRRQVHLEMTEKARSTGAMLFAPLARHIDAVFDRYSEEQLELLRDMLQDVTDATVAARDVALDGG